MADENGGPRRGLVSLLLETAGETDRRGAKEGLIDARFGELYS